MSGDYIFDTEPNKTVLVKVPKEIEQYMSDHKPVMLEPISSIIEIPVQNSQTIEGYNPTRKIKLEGTILKVYPDSKTGYFIPFITEALYLAVFGNILPRNRVWNDVIMLGNKNVTILYNSLNKGNVITYYNESVINFAKELRKGGNMEELKNII